MSLAEVKKTLEQRRYNLVNALENNRDELDLSKQHQIYGAIQELDNIIKTIDYYRELEVNNQFDFRLSNEQHQTLFEKISLKVRKSNTEIKRKTIELNR